LLNTLSVFAQNTSIIIDTTFLKCEYKTLYYKDTLKFKDAIWMDDEFILQIGTKISKYYSKNTDEYERMRSDPDAMAAFNEAIKTSIESIIMNLPARHSTLVIYNNYPKGKRIVQVTIVYGQVEI